MPHLARRIAFLALVLALSAACGTRTPGKDPHVVATDPANDAVGVSPTTAIRVTFDRAMLAASITTNTSDDGCSGTLALSFDDFSTCVRMSAPVASNGGLTFSAVPTMPLQQGATYRLRVKASATSASGRLLGEDFTQPDGFTVALPASPTPTPAGPYSHTIAIDGANDFVQADERFSTSSSATGYYGFVAWDSSNLYLAMSGSDIGSGSSTKWFVAYLGTGGTMTGQTYNTQTPGLPFPAKYHVRWKADNSYTNAQVWSGSAWVDAGWDFTGRVFKTVGGNYLEMSLRRSDLGSPAHVPLVMGMLNEQAGAEASYAAVPANAYLDGLNPPFAHYYDFDLTAPTVPNATAVQ